MTTYTNPGVTVSVINTPVITSATGSPTNICLVGQAPATQSVNNDNYTLGSSTAIAVVSNPNVVPVTSGTNNTPYFYYSLNGVQTTGITNLYSGQVYSLGTDYQIGLTGTTQTVIGSNGQSVPPGTAFITSGQTTLTTTGTATAGTVTLALYVNGVPITTTANGSTQATATFNYNDTATTIKANISAAIAGAYLNGSPITSVAALNLTLTVTNPLNVSATPTTITFTPTSLTASTFNTVTFSTTTSGYAPGTASLAASNTMTSASGTYPVWLNLNYQFAPTYGNVLQLFNSFSAVTAVYGNPFTSTGAINSPLSLGAYLAFQNGASQVYAIAVGSSSSSGVTPSTTITPFQLEYVFTNILAGNNNIDTIVPLFDYSTNNALMTFLNSYVNGQASSGTLQRLFLSRDTSTFPIPQTTVAQLTNDAQFFSNQRISVFYPTSIAVPTFNTSANSLTNIAGYYGAAATAGVLNSLSGPEIPLTHKVVQGFYNIPGAYTSNNLISLQASGVLCLSQRSNGDIYIRQGLTTNMSNFLTQEISIIAAQDALFEAIRKNLVNADIIGNAFTPNTPSVITSLVQGVLTSAVNNNLIQAFSGIQYSVPSNNPTQVNITFQYSPTFPLNYINVAFSIDPTAGTTNFSSTTNAYNTVGA